MLWLIAAISCYLIFAIVFLIDKYLISGPIPSPKVYAFYVGILGILSLILIPFINFYIPSSFQIFLSFLSGAFFIYALFWLYKVLNLFEASRAAPAIGGFLSIFTFLLLFFVSGGKAALQFQEFSAFIFLISGTVLICYEKTKFSLKSLFFSAIAAFVWALYFVSVKYVYLGQSFWNGFLWIRIGAGLSALSIFLFSKEVKREVLKEKLKPSFSPASKKTAGLFIFNQSLSTIANILQNWAVYLVPLVYVSLITALQGVQYIFLLIFALIISLKFPQIIKEEISPKTLFQKIIAIFLIGTGLAILAI